MRVWSALFLISAMSCAEETSKVGSDFFDGGDLNMATVDTITLETSTIMFDSLVTNDATRLLVGSHKDEDLGVVSAITFFEMGISSALSIDKQFTSFTRAELRLVNDGYSFYDTMSSITFTVHELLDEIILPSENPYLYNTSKVSYDPTPMSNVTLKARPKTKDTVKIALPAQFGRDIIRLAQGSAREVSTASNFIDYFHGFTLVPSGVDGPIVGFAEAVEVRIYYLDKSQTPGVERYLQLESSENFRFNHISYDRSGTDLETLTSQRYPVTSKATSRKAYIQSGAGLGVRVSIPYLHSILIDNPELNIVNAVLEIAPVRDNVGRNIELPERIVMSSVDYRNLLIESYSTTISLDQDHYLGRDTHYKVDVTGFINQQLAIQEFNDNALVFTTDDPTFRSSVDRLYVGDQFSDRPLKLTLTCLTYKK